jgi:predicted adenine nucleotide alpha hydrolase (AANH) superfamily ATPase
VKPHERQAWNNRPTECKTFTLCEDCNVLKEDTQKREETIYVGGWYNYSTVKVKGLCCKACFDLRLDRAREGDRLVEP